MKRKFIVALGLAVIMALALTCAVGCVEDVGEHTHTWATEWSSDENSHWHACKGDGCAERSDVANHLGGTATCKTKAVCDICETEYGELNNENHESAEFTYTANNDGTHKKTYKCCGVTATENEKCSGGTATCKTKAKCTLCGGEHGELNAENHESDEYTYTANGDGTHKKEYKCCGAVAIANEECSGGAATCVKKAECTLCGAEYGDYSAEHAYTDGLDTSDEEYDYKKCVCGELDREHGFKKTVNTDNQQLVMTSETIAIDLEGVSEYASIKSIMLGEVDLGNDISALAFGDIKTDEKQHGAKVIKVIVIDADGLEHEITVNVILVTQVITTDAELKTLLREEKTSGGVQEDVYGYYVLGNDIVYSGSRNYVKFMGTFDGNEKTITTSQILNGLFTYAWYGCVIKDLTIKATLSPLASNYRTVLANDTYSATFINLAVIYEGGADSSELNDGGFLFRGGSSGNIFKNLTVIATGKKIGSLLGQKMTNTTFTDCVVYADAVTCLAGMTDGTNKVEFADTEGIELKQAEPIEIELWQESISLGTGDLFNGKNIIDIKCGEYSFGKDLTNLIIPEEVKADKTLHGNTLIGVKTSDGAKVYLLVTLVTGEIKTEAEFKDATFIADENTTKFGYYRLANDIILTDNIAAVQSYGAEADKNIGFRGGIDGQGKYTISTAAGKYVTGGGIFGLLGSGAVIKDVKFNVAVWESAMGMFGSQGHNATIQNVEITFKAAPTVEKAGHYGAFFARYSGTMNYKNVTLNAAGCDLATIFGVNLDKNMTKCDNVVVNAKSIVVIGYGTWGGEPMTTLTGFTFNETLA